MTINTSIKADAIRGSVWTLGGYGTSQILRLGSHLLIAWLLAPEIFGLMAMVKVVQQGLAMFSDIGIKPAIIQSERGDDSEFINTAWTLQIIRGFVLFICWWILAWPIAALFARNDPVAWQLMYLLPVVGIGSIINGFCSTALATLNRDLQLGRITMLELSTQLVSLTVIVVWALVSPSVWAMVAGGLVASAYRMVASHFIVRGYRVRLRWKRECAYELFRFSRWIFISTVFTFLAANVDKLILGNVLTMAELGLYSIAFVFGRLALNISSRLSGTVLFPVLSKYQHDRDQMMSVALRGREIVLWAGMGACLVIAVGSPLFFQTLWDTRYHNAGMIAQWATLYVWSSIVLQSMDRIPLALGNSRSLFVANVWRSLGIGLAVAGYVLADLPGFLVGFAIGPIISHTYLLRHIPVRRGAVMAQSGRFTLGGLIYGVPAVLVAWWIGANAQFWTWASSVALLAAIPMLVAVWMGWRLVRGDSVRNDQQIPSLGTIEQIGL